MARPKKAEVIAEEPGEIVKDTAFDVPAGPSPRLIRCTVERWFCDGNTKDRFAKFGYGCEWKAGEVRFIDQDLYDACKISGARLELNPE